MGSREGVLWLFLHDACFQKVWYHDDNLEFSSHFCGPTGFEQAYLSTLRDFRSIKPSPYNLIGSWVAYLWSLSFKRARVPPISSLQKDSLELPLAPHIIKIIAKLNLKALLSVMAPEAGRKLPSRDLKGREYGGMARFDHVSSLKALKARDEHANSKIS